MPSHLDKPASYLQSYIYGGMGGDRDPYHYVIEVLYGELAWIVSNPPPHKCDALCLRLSQAQIYTESGARNTISRIHCGYPLWAVRMVRFTDAYRAWHGMRLPRIASLILCLFIDQGYTWVNKRHAEVERSDWPVRALSKRKGRKRAKAA